MLNWLSFDSAILAKDMEIGQLKAKFHGADENTRASPPSMLSEGETENNLPTQWRGRAPPVQVFMEKTASTRSITGYSPLIRAADWKGWTKPELLIQLAGHPKCCTCQEWSLLEESKKSDYDKGRYGQGWIQAAKRWLPRTSVMQHR